tara:strand:+ start:1088 stop:2041 length:954 start_codon:yes stop_codon:yes gene_type:complete
MNIVPFAANSHAKIWDDFLETSSCSTFLHSYKFLSYHKNRFVDRSLLLFSDDTLLCILPAASFIDNLSRVISHPGSTYGGLVFSKQVTPEIFTKCLSEIIKYFESIGITSLSVKLVPFIYSLNPSELHRYSLFQYGFTLSHSSLSSVVNLKHRLPLSSRRKRSLKKALISSATISWDTYYLNQYWELLCDNLAIRHNCKPTHSLAEIQDLFDRFPHNILLVTAIKDSRVCAGIIFFNNYPTFHAQYIASNVTGNNICALDLLFNAAFDFASERDFSFFDFGISTTDGGTNLNNSLYKFKSEFGATPITYDTFTFSFS